ncbi:VTT domain-containing protein [Domibacillus sp. A3M-37]|uniref:TVP38/TMEM64 family protein n=1 Tax=Domibacillus sp. A3M-37 TaxID=2962037 RepID=UPI0020B752D9|nr:VTT domain-containing protein [Domibacillus sp. A3M-37]MCP3764334.1 VTT domain-containing protein [Domibacillus sp. A3M-37]
MMEAERWIEGVIQQAGWFGPVFFIVLHIVRPFLLLPVVVVCIAGGYLFGFVQGTIYSIIGLSLMGAVFYKLVHWFPSVRDRMLRIKRKVAGERKMTVGQVMILRVMPFVHFHLLSVYLIDMTKSFREYMQFSVLGVITPALLYTAFGEVIQKMPWYASMMFLTVLLILYALIERRNKKRQPESSRG